MNQDSEKAGSRHAPRAHIARRPESWIKSASIVGIAILILIPAGYGFVEKVVQFVRTVTSDVDSKFTVFPILNYLIAAAGFVCLLIWASANGMFRNIEEPKYTMLERERELDAMESASHPDRQSL